MLDFPEPPSPQMVMFRRLFVVVGLFWLVVEEERGRGKVGGGG